MHLDPPLHQFPKSRPARPSLIYWRLRTLACILLAACGAGEATTTSLFAQSSDRPEIAKLEVGFGGAYKVGYWTPLKVTIRGGADPLEGRLQITVPDGDGVATQVTSMPNRPIVVLPGREITVPLFAKIGQVTPDIEVTLIAGGRQVRSRTFSSLQGDLPTSLSTQRPLAVGLGTPLGLLPGVEPADSTQPVVYVPIDRSAMFPTRWYGYDAVSHVLICTADAGAFRSLSATSAQIEALDNWVRLGGRLILAVGSQADEALAATSPFARFVPGTFSGMVTIKQSSAWETFAETNERLDAKALAAGAADFRMDVPKLTNTRGTIEAYEGSQPSDLPLVVRAPHGLGEVVFVAADLDRPPFTKWAGGSRMLSKLLRLPLRSDEADDNTASAQQTAYGYDDLAGQLRGALEQFRGVKLVPFSLVATLIVLYILAIGPLDYFLLKRGFKRMEWTWFTFPTMVLAFSITAYVLAYALKGNLLRVNQVDVIDYDADTKLVRGTVWSNIFSPRVDAYDISYRPQLLGDASLTDDQSLVSWLGLPGASFGGMHSPAGGTSLFRGAYAFSPALDELIGMPIAVWSTKGVTARWSGTAESPVQGELTDGGDGLLKGDLISRLDQPLENCALVYGRWAYPIGKLEPRARIKVESKLDPQTVETYFKRITMFHEKDAVSTFDPGSLEVDRVVETMMLFDLLGGQRYAKLSNDYQRFIDLSPMLQSGRAILMGQSSAPGSTLYRGKNQPIAGENDLRFTFVRFVLPVSQARN